MKPSLFLLLFLCSFSLIAADQRPNILFAIADDWGFPHAGVYGDKVVKTPVFDTLGKSGIIFNHAYISAPSCAPSRAAIVTGQWHWRLKEGANLYGPIPRENPLYTIMLDEAGYHVGMTRKGWGPGSSAGWPHNPAGKSYKNFDAFLKARPKGKPFCFWFGSHDPHRGYVKDSGAKSGIDINAIQLPGCFPDSQEVRGDVADYYFEVQRFDREVGEMVETIKKMGEFENTLIIITGDHGMPFPRGKSNLYDLGTRVPLVAHWPAKINKPASLNNFVSLIDLAPTFLEAAGIKVPEIMNGQSLVPMFTPEFKSEQGRKIIITGKERHVPVQEAPNPGGYPCRSLRNHKYLLIRNFEVEWWPAGTPNYEKAFIPGGWLGDCDNGPTKSYMVDNKDKDSIHKKLYELSFGFRPEWELYDVEKDPHQLNNVAGESGYAEVLTSMKKQLMDELAKAGDPRATGETQSFQTYPYSGGSPKFPGFKKPKAKK